MTDPDFRIATYRSANADKPWLARVQHPRTKLHIFFEAGTEGEVIALAEAFWEERRVEREDAWARQDAAKVARLAKKAA